MVFSYTTKVVKTNEIKESADIKFVFPLKLQ